jgi:histone deacetylase complex regulatory component SIN3
MTFLKDLKKGIVHKQIEYAKKNFSSIATKSYVKFWQHEKKLLETKNFLEKNSFKENRFIVKQHLEKMKANWDKTLHSMSLIPANQLDLEQFSFVSENALWCDNRLDELKEGKTLLVSDVDWMLARVRFLVKEGLKDGVKLTEKEAELSA